MSNAVIIKKLKKIKELIEKPYYENAHSVVSSKEKTDDPFMLSCYKNTQMDKANELIDGLIKELKNE